MDNQAIEKIFLDHFDDEILEKLTRLSETTYPGREISIKEYLRWEYLSNPFGQAVGAVAISDQKIVSQYLVIPRKFMIGGEPVEGSLSVNTLTHPGFRRRGLFPELASKTFQRCRDSGVHFTIGFPNSRSHPIIRRKNIFITPGYLPLLVKAINPISSFFRYVTIGRERTGDEINLETDENVNSDSISFLDFEKDRKNYEEFLAAVNKEKGNLTMRSPEFMKWRYIDIPTRKYRLIKLQVEGRIRAIAVLRARKVFGMRCGILVDLVSNGGSDDPRLCRFIDDLAARNRLDLIIASVPVHSTEFKMLNNSGYFSLPQFILPQRLAFIIQTHLSCPPAITDFKKWFLTFGDYDIF